MLFNSFEFAVFFPLVFLMYWFVTKKNLTVQNAFLLVVSYLFYGWWDWRFLGLLFFSSTLDYIIALRIDASQTIARKKFFVGLAIAINLTLLGFFKYFNFFSDSFAELLTTLGFQANRHSLNVILPVGISFYTFQSMSYYIDVYRGKMKPVRDIIAFYAYVSFFPQLVAGPIERSFQLLPQFLRKRVFDYAQGVAGMRLILWGLFKKIVIADNCAEVVNTVFNNYQNATGFELLSGIVLFALQIYGDFSGYSDIARGTAKLLGFELMINFKTPYFSRDIAEFWRRWHISLTTWFRDYVYIPLGGNKDGKYAAVRNTVIVFALSGFWHGANWTFVIWGLLNALYFIPLVLTGQNKKNLDTVAEDRFLPSPKEFVQMVFTFSLVCFAWIFFRAANLSEASGYISALFTHGFAGVNIVDFNKWLPLVIGFWLLLEWMGRFGGVDEYLATVANRVNRHALYYGLAIIIALFGAFKETSFIYFQF
jgi:alginate O-acetyltransferase complex protein AlgI